MAHDEPVIEADGLVRDYPGRRVVDAVDLAVERGQAVGLLGPNGASKTTTLCMLSGTLAPTAGRIAIAGTDLIDPSSAPRRNSAISRSARRSTPT